MLSYKRNITAKLLSLRLSFFVLVIACFLLFKFQYESAGYFLVAILLALSIIVVKGLEVYNDSFQIIKYYFFGLISWKWRFNKKDIVRVTPVDPDPAGGDDIDAGAVVPEAGCLFLFISIFGPPKNNNEVFNVGKFDEIGKAIRIVKVRLNEQELNLLLPFIKQN